MNTRPIDPHANAFCRILAEMLVEQTRGETKTADRKRHKQKNRKRK